MVAFFWNSVKYSISLTLAATFSLLVFFQNTTSAGEYNSTTYFAGKQQGAANTVFELPVQVISTENTTTTAAPKTYIRSSQKSACELQPLLCEKIKFGTGFSGVEKRRYQKLIMTQILSIDKLLTTSKTLQESLYTITLNRERGTRRARAGNSTIIVNLGNIGSEREFIEVLTHELGHIVDLTVLTKNSSFKPEFKVSYGFDDPSLEFYAISRESESTRKASAWYMSFVGGYAMSDPFEDFAESFNLYLNHYAVFAVLATSDKALKAKHEYMGKLLGKKYLKADTATALTMKDDLKQRVRDTTKGY